MSPGAAVCSKTTEGAEDAAEEVIEIKDEEEEEALRNAAPRHRKPSKAKRSASSAAEGSEWVLKAIITEDKCDDDRRERQQDYRARALQQEGPQRP